MNALKFQRTGFHGSYLRSRRTRLQWLGLLEDGVSEAEILSQMLEHPVLVNRPIVCTSKGVKLCRPSEAVIDILDNKPKGPFHKEDGALMIYENGVLQE